MLRLIILASIKKRRLQQITMFQIEKLAGPACKNSGKYAEIEGSRGPRPKLTGMPRKIAPHRTWNFVEINVPYEEATQCRKQIIDRMAPLDTVMDLVSIM